MSKDDQDALPEAKDVEMADADKTEWESVWWRWWRTRAKGEDWEQGLDAYAWACQEELRRLGRGRDG